MPGTAVPLIATRLPCAGVLLRPLIDAQVLPPVGSNTSYITIGDSGGHIMPILPNDTCVWWPCVDASDVYIDAVVANEGVTWQAFEV